MKTFLVSLALMLLPAYAFAVDTTTTYQSGILTLIFVGFCALLIIAQLVPAVLILFGMIKAVKPAQKDIKVKSN